MQPFQIATLRLVLETATHAIVVATRQPLNPDSALHEALTTTLHAIGVEHVTWETAYVTEHRLEIHLEIGNSKRIFPVNRKNGLVIDDPVIGGF